MPEIREVKTQVVDQKCPVCGQGYMRPNGVVNQTNPPSYEHSCTSCGHTATYGMRYPYNI
jgi:transposase-like protein